MLFVLVGIAVLAGAIAQRISGMGFALVVAPVLVLLLGPFDGVLMVNICGAVSASIVVTRVWAHIDWKQYVLLVTPAVIAIIPGALVSVLLGGPVLQIVVGGILVLALTVSLVVTARDYTVSRAPAGVVSGAASGFMSAAAGISGPAVGVYAVLTRWEQRGFAATVQPYFATLGIVSFVSKIAASGFVFPEYDWWLWVVVIACTVVGLAVGERLAPRVSARVARLAVICVSYVGGVVAIVDGAFSLAA